MVQQIGGKMKRIVICALLALPLLVSGAEARKGGWSTDAPSGSICSACSRYGSGCCAMKKSISACIQCGAKYDRDVQTRWCQTNQPVCAK
jgi:hypothetical protein